MESLDITPKPSPPLSMPPNGATCSLFIIDTTCNLTVPAKTLVEPVISGHEMLNLPTVSFLITNQTLGKKVLFDLGCRKDFWNLPTPIAKVIDEKVPGIKVDKDLSEILVEGGIDLQEIDAAIISHHHYDHAGNPGTFPISMDLVVGPGFKEAFLPGWPSVEASPIHEEAFKGRRVEEVEFPDDFKIAGYPALDYFQDGSLYVLDTPGHAIGHLSALVRTTDDSFVFLGGDICHFGGSFRPTPYVPMPKELTGKDINRQDNLSAVYACSLFTDCHPNPDPTQARTSPYYQTCSRSDSWYVNPPQACETIERLKNLDAKDNVLVLIAHDPAIMKTVPFFPNGDLNDWWKMGVKKALRWMFMDELPIEGKEVEYLVPGTFMNGQLIKHLDGRKAD